MIAAADFPFTKEQLFEAETRYQKDPASTTDRDLQMFATYDPSYAAKAASARERAQTPKQIAQPVPAQRTDQHPHPANAIILKWFAEAEPGDDDVWPTVEKAININPSEPTEIATFACLAMLVVGMNAKNRERNVKIAALEAKIAELEARPRLMYRGVWKDGEPYEPGDVVTRSGSMWHCGKATKNSIPSEDHESWTLCVKGAHR